MSESLAIPSMLILYFPHHWAEMSLKVSHITQAFSSLQRNASAANTLIQGNQLTRILLFNRFTTFEWLAYL